MQYHTASQTAKTLGVSLSTLWRLKERNNIQTYSNPADGRFVYYSEDSIEQLRRILSGNVFEPIARSATSDSKRTI